MRLAFIDCETTGLLLDSDCITELAWVIKDSGDEKPFVLKSKLIHTERAIPPEITALTKITRKHLDEVGCDIETVIKDLEDDLLVLKVDYIVAHNGHNFDRPMLYNCIKREMPECRVDSLIMFNTPWLDTRHDILFPENWTSHRLGHLAAELGFLNYFAHSALFDVATMIKVFEAFPLDKIIARSKEPWVIIRAVVDYNDREKAKKRRFSWQTLGDKTFEKCWVKRVKASEVDKERKEANFEITIMETEENDRSKKAG